MTETMSQPPPTGKSRQETVRALRNAMARWEESVAVDERPRVGSGCEALDRLLPAGGLVRGTLVEWLGVGASMLALLAAREALRGGGPLVVIDGQRTFYPPAAIAWGIDPARMILVHPINHAELQWSLDQVLRCTAVAAVMCWPERLAPKIFRRLQLAVEASGGLGLLVRSETAQAEPSWAELRWQVRPLPSAASWWRLHVELLHLRGGMNRGQVELEINPQTGSVRGGR